MSNNKIKNTLLYLSQPKMFFGLGLFLALCIIFWGSNGFASEECAPMGKMAESWRNNCYPCVIVKVLLETFMLACSKAYSVSREAGIKILVVGIMIWIIPFVMKNVSSLTNVEAPNMMNELLKFGFKVIVAYLFITSGIGTLIGYAVNPILSAGADFAKAILDSAQDAPSTVVSAKYAYSGNSDIISASVMNKIMAFSEDASKKVATNMIIGQAMMCFSVEAGFSFFSITIPDIWMLFCGVVIWFCGFMLTLSICYYLLDISFKIGFAVLILPLVIGLWPFGWGQSKLKTCISIILKAAATFAFLSITTSYAITLVDSAINGVDELLAAIAEDNVTYVEKQFSIMDGQFLILLFCYIYSIKLVGSTINDYVNKFFPDGVFGDSSPMHHKMTGVTDRVKGAVMAPVNLAKDVALHQAGKATMGLSKLAGKGAKATFSGLKQATKDPKKAGQNAVGNSAEGAGDGIKAAGAATENAGKGMQAAGKTAQAAGKTAQAAGKGMNAAGSGMTNAGKALSSTGLGAIIGVPLMAIGMATQGAGKVTEATGKVAEKAGQATEKAGKATEKAGKAVKKTGDTIKKAGEHVNKVAEEDDKEKKK